MKISFFVWLLHCQALISWNGSWFVVGSLHRRLGIRVCVRFVHSYHGASASFWISGLPSKLNLPIMAAMKREQSQVMERVVHIFKPEKRRRPVLWARGCVRTVSLPWLSPLVVGTKCWLILDCDSTDLAGIDDTFVVVVGIAATTWVSWAIAVWLVRSPQNRFYYRDE